MEIDFGVMDSLLRAKLEEADNVKENREAILVMYDESDEECEQLNAKIKSLEGEMKAYYNLLDLLVLFVPEEYKLPVDRNRAFSVKVDVEKFRNLISRLRNEISGEVNSVKSGGREMILIEDIERQAREKTEGKNMDEIRDMMLYEDGLTGVYEWIDTFLDNMMTSYEGGDNYFE